MERDEKGLLERRWASITVARKKSIEERYDVLCPIGGGGNAIALRVKEKATGQDWVVKILVAMTKVKKARFIEEIRVQSLWRQVSSGIMPIHDSSEDHFWYVMPACTLVAEWIDDHAKNGKERALLTGMAVFSYSQTLQELHRENVYHRDLKPDNLYVKDGKFLIGDFGLVDTPDTEGDLTKTGEAVGATFTMAPEMRRYPKQAEASKADVYSLAKTLWILLSKEPLGFAGRYDWADDVHRLTRFKHLKELCLVGVEELLHKSTANAPDERPTMEGFSVELASAIIAVSAEWAKTQDLEWSFLGQQMFNGNTPLYAEFEGLDTIRRILRCIGMRPAYNQIMYPEFGSMDFEDVMPAKEYGCLEIRVNGVANIVKPKRLTMETFPQDVLWNYCLLELDDLTPDPCYSPSGKCQSLVEEPSGRYGRPDTFSYGVYDYADPTTKIPEGSRLVTRLLGGKMLIVPKSGPYNRILSTTDGRHNQCDTVQFRRYMRWLMKQFWTDCKISSKPMEFILSAAKYRVNPFVDMVTFDERKMPKFANTWIEGNWTSFQFDVRRQTSANQRTRSAEYVIALRGVWGGVKSYFEPPLLLTVDGRLSATETPLVFESEEDVLNVMREVERQLDKICNDKEFSGHPDIFFSADLHKVHNTVHHIERTALRKVLKEGDGRIANKLVVDVVGNWKLSQVPCHVEWPVSFETFAGGGNYVGRYSEWQDSELDRMCVAAKDAWANYCASGSGQVVDFY